MEATSPPDGGHAADSRNEYNPSDDLQDVPSSEEKPGAEEAAPQTSTTRRPAVSGWCLPVSLVLLLMVVVILSLVISGLSSGTGGRDSMASEGKSIYSRECASCHGQQGGRIPAAPLSSRQFIESLGAHLEGSVSDGKGAMPAWGTARGGPLSPQQVKAVVEYLRSTAGLANVAISGKELYLKHCASCHGEKGNRLAGFPLHSREYLDSLGQTALTETIAQGSGIMLAFGQEKGGPLNASEVQAIVRHLANSAVSTGPPDKAATRPRPTGILPAPAREAAPAAAGVAAAAPTPAAAILPAPPPVPAGSPLEQGKEIYEKSCLTCHGDRGNKIVNVNLNSGEFLNRRGEATLLKSIGEGRGVMPASARESGGSLSDEEIRKVYSYLLFLAQAGPQQPSPASAGPPPQVPAQAGVAPASSVGTGAGPAASAQRSPPDIAHGIQEREDKCLNCHGRDSVKPVPVTHAGRTNPMCLYCHKVRSGVQERAAGSPRPPGPPPIPHPLEGRENRCKSCHGPGGMPPMPEPHNRFETNQCHVCHRVSYVPPTPPPVSTSQGEELYRRMCIDCHGERGDKLPNVRLGSADYLQEQGDARLATVIGAGNGRGMPVLGVRNGGSLSDAQIGGIVNYLKSLAGLGSTGPE